MAKLSLKTDTITASPAPLLQLCNNRFLFGSLRASPPTINIADYISNVMNSADL